MFLDFRKIQMEVNKLYVENQAIDVLDVGAYNLDLRSKKIIALPKFFMKWMLYIIYSIIYV